MHKGRQWSGTPSGSVCVGGPAQVVSPHHAFDTALGIDDALLAGPERMTFAADFSPQALFRGTNFPRISARTRYGGVIVILWMNFSFHIGVSPD